MDSVIDKLFNYGLPTALLAILLYGLWQGVSWLGPNFLTPIKDQVIQHLGKVDTAIDGLMILVRGQTEALERQNEVLQRVEVRIEETGADTDSHTEVLNRIDENVLELKQSAKQFFRESHTEYQQSQNSQAEEHG